MRGEGKIGEITRAIQDLYLAAVHGEVEEFRQWLTPVYDMGEGALGQDSFRA